MIDSLRRRGLSLIELLVVVAIIATLIGLLIPAVQRVRSTAQLTACQNNLKQMALAFHQFHATHQVLPTAGGCCDHSWPRAMANGTPAGYATQTWGWGYQTLPYLDQEALYRQPNDADVRATVVPYSYCPDRRGPTVFGEPPNARAKGDYVANGGDRDGGEGNTKNTHMTGPLAGATDQDNPEGRRPPPVKILSPTTLSSITDGTTNTLLLAEKYLTIPFYSSYDPARPYMGSQYGDINSMYGPNSWDTVRFSANPPKRDDASLAFDGGPAEGGGTNISVNFFGSAHMNGFNAAMCDGSVRSIRFDINIDTLRALSTRAGGETVD